jgi:DNA-binding SARP family transcriptional activator
MSKLRFRLFGEPHIEVEQKPLTGFVSTKAQALLIYLVMSPGRHSRNRLANLLWSEFTDEQARNNLRTALSNLRGLVGPHLDIERETVAYKRDVPYWLDVDVVRETFGSPLEKQAVSRIDEATALYQGDLLDGFQVRNAPIYEDWVVNQRESLHGLVLRGLSQIADRCIAQGEYERGLAVTRRLLTVEPWREQSHRQHLLLLAYTNQRTAAMAQYETCRTILRDEFGVEPMPETTALFEKIKAGAITPPHPPHPTPTVEAHRWLGRLTGFVRSAVKHADASPLPHEQGFIDWDSIPDSPPLVGREEEVRQLIRWLNEETSRLIGVHGMGGQGKSALVASVVRSLIGSPPMAGHSGGGLLPGTGVETASGEFQVVLWHSLASASDLRHWVHHWISFLANREIDPSIGADELILTVIECMRRWRCLIVFDDVDGILQPGGNAGLVMADQAIYRELFKRVASSIHQSSLVVISRESLVDIEGSMRGREHGVKNLWLGPLPSQASQVWLTERGVSGNQPVLAEIAERYSGNPLALGVVADAIRNLHFGDGLAFLESPMPVFDAIRSVMDDQFVRLSTLEQEMMVVLEQAQESLTWSELAQRLSTIRNQGETIEAQLSLLRRGLVVNQPTGITLPALVLGYMREGHPRPHIDRISKSNPSPATIA